MGLRCLIGHEYGDAQTERDRRQQDSEVVVTVKEYRECRRCGHRRIISENTEVKIEPPAASESATPADASWSPPEPNVGDVGTDPDRSPIDLGADEFHEADEDDGVILEDEPDTSLRAHGEWPTAGRDVEDTDPGQADYKPWPDEPPNGRVASSESGSTASPSAQAGDDTDSGHRLPVAGGAPSTSMVDETVPGEDNVVPDLSTEEAIEPVQPTNPRDAELVCPDCADTWPSMNSSLRPGDICPVCRGNYLEERLVQ